MFLNQHDNENSGEEYRTGVNMVRANNTRRDDGVDTLGNQRRGAGNAEPRVHNARRNERNEKRCESAREHC